MRGRDSTERTHLIQVFPLDAIVISFELSECVYVALSQHSLLKLQALFLSTFVLLSGNQLRARAAFASF